MDFEKPDLRSMTMVPVPVKKQRIGEPTSKFNEVATFRNPKQQIVPTGEAGSMPRTSSLQAPNMLLSGHEGEVYCAKFINSDGALIASAGFDRRVFIWSTYGECDNIAVLQGHGGAILDLQTSTDGDLMFTTSSDKTIGVWDIETGSRIKRIRGHENIVNCVSIARRGPQIICSGSDDNTVKLWDTRYKKQAQSFNNNYQVLSCTFNDTSEVIYTGGIDNVIKAWDLRRLDVSLRLSGHTDTVTGLSLSPDGNFILSNAMDQTLRVWDIRPFVQGDRCSQIFQGHTHTFEKNLLRCAWSPDGKKISCGSGDKFVYVWDRISQKLLYKLPGHSASINETAFHQYEPIIMSASSDKKIFVGEINIF